MLGSIQPQPIPQSADGTLPLELVAKAIKPEVRLVVHMDISDDGVGQTVAAISEFFT